MVPPLTGVAVKLTLVPWQTGLEAAATETLTAWLAFTVMETELEVAGLPVAQEALEVSRQVTASPLAGV